MFLEKGFPPDWSTHRRLIWESMLSGGSSLPWTTFIGNPLQFSAPKAHTLRSTTVEFAPKQSGTGDPSPDNVRPISGWTGIDTYVRGVNLFDADNVIPSMRIDANTVGAHTTYNLFVVPVAKNTQYTFNQTDHANGYPVFALANKYPENGDTVYNQASLRNLATYTFNSGDYKYALFALYKSSGDVFSVTLGSEAIAIDTPYTGSTTTLTFPSTVYGGTATVAEDGTVTVTVTETWEAEDMGSKNWAYYEPSATYPYGYFRTSEFAKANGRANMICEVYPVYDMSVGTLPDKSMAGSTNSGQVFVVDSTYSDKTTFAQSLSGVYLCFELAEPIIIHLSSVEQLTALAGINTMWTDGDTLTVEARGEAVNNA